MSQLCQFRVGDMVMITPERRVLPWQGKPHKVDAKNYSKKDGKWAYRTEPFGYYWEEDLQLTQSL